MLRYFILFMVVLLFQKAVGQQLLSREEAIQLSLSNQRNLKAANLGVQQQEQLRKGSAGIENPEVFVETSPYEGPVAGAQQSFRLPSVYRNRIRLQEERIRLAQLQLRGSQLDLKKDVYLSYLQLQYLSGKIEILLYQDSIYQGIKSSSKRFFDAGQINKLEELQASTEADRIRNELLRTEDELKAEFQIFRFYTGTTDTFRVETLDIYPLVDLKDTSVFNIQQQILDQQVRIFEREVKVQRSELLPGVNAGVLFPLSGSYERPFGYQVGISIPIWQRQNRSRVAAAQTGVEIARATQDLEKQKLNAQYRQALLDLQKEQRSISYFNSTALTQARNIMETSQRLFRGGELNYIESLRNLQTAFEIFLQHAETVKNYNEAVIQINYLNATL